MNLFTQAFLFSAVSLMFCCDDSSPTFDANTVLQSDARAFDANLNSCDPDYIWNGPDGRALVVGDYCDDLSICVANATDAASIVAIAPGFTCRNNGCGDGEFSCEWFTAGEIDVVEYADLCRISNFADSSNRIECHVYL